MPSLFQHLTHLHIWRRKRIIKENEKDKKGDKERERKNIESEYWRCLTYGWCKDHFFFFFLVATELDSTCALNGTVTGGDH